MEISYIYSLYPYHTGNQITERIKPTEPSYRVQDAINKCICMSSDIAKKVLHTPDVDPM